MSLSCPSVVVGGTHQVCRQTDAPTIEIPFDSSLRSFAIDVCVADTVGEADLATMGRTSMTERNAR